MVKKSSSRTKKLKLTDNALTLLKLRYLRKDEEGNVIETPEQMFRRVAKAMASVEKMYGKTDKQVKILEDEFYAMMANLLFLPNSPTMMNAGDPTGTLSACYVLPVEDSMEKIFETIRDAAITQKSGGGTGFAFSRLRPKGDLVKSTHGVAAGPIFFLGAFDSALKGIRQAYRRYATNMGILKINHPDIQDFITAKQREGTITTFNISVGITDDFMYALENGGEYNLINPRTGKPMRKISAHEIFDKIVNNAWTNGEPGVIFVDTINKLNPTNHIGEIEATNPCAEIPLHPYESCNLGSIDISKFVITKNGKPSVDWDKLKKIVRLAVHFLDNLIDINYYPVPEMDRMAKANRRIGLGVMGFADMLIKLNIQYNSEEGLNIGEKLMEFIKKESHKISQELAKEKGSFFNFKDSRWEKEGYKYMRNATVTGIAPTSNLSIIAGCSHSIEPLFSISYVRNVKSSLGINLIETNPLFEQITKERGFYSKELMEKVLKKGSIQDMEEIPEDIRRIFVTSHDIAPEWHVRMQAAFQKYTDNAVSKTVNFPHHAKPEDIAEVYRLAYKLGCKGVTVYRDGSRQFQIINTPESKSKAESNEEVLAEELDYQSGCATCHL